jgi:hypothetical protein
MPCFTNQRISLEFKAEHLDVLEDAAKALGYRPQRVGETLTFYTANGTATFRDGKLNINSRDRNIVDKLNRSYCEQVIERVGALGKKYGWAMSKVSANKYRMAKR